MRIKRPDKKNALSLLDAAKKEMEYTLTLPVSEKSGATIVRNIYESFRMLGDALLALKGTHYTDHIAPIKELVKLEVRTTRPISSIDNLRRFRHNINYYGYSPKLSEVQDVISLAKSCFTPLFKEIKKRVER